MSEQYKRFIPWMCRRSFAAVAVLGTLAFGSAPLFADPVGVEALLSKARSEGQIRVIVTMQTPDLPARSSMSKRDYDRALTRAASTLQSDLLDSIAKSSIRGEPKRFPYTPQCAITVTEQGLSQLAGHPSVIAVQEDVPVPAVLNQSVPLIFPQHDVSPYSGSGWAVAILDTGVDKNHSFLSGKVVSEACYSDGGGQTSSTSVCPGGALSSTASGAGIPCPANIDGCDHGTHTAGIAAGSGTGFTGVAQDADIISIQVFSKFTGPDCTDAGLSSPCSFSWISDQVAALQRVYALRTTLAIAAANLSIGGGRHTSACDNDARKATIDLLKNAGVATVVASGNTGFDDAVTSPGCISTAVTVGASTAVDHRASFSNNSPLLDLYAPGEWIQSSVPGGGFESWDGTSAAAPHVAGAWAVMRQKYSSRSVDDIETAFKASGVTITSFGISRQRIDVDQALAFYSGPADGSAYVSLVPCRIVDTRKAAGNIPAKGVRHYKVWGSDGEIGSQGGTGDCGIPPDAAAVVLNITSDQPSNAGLFKVFPFSVSEPNASSINFQAGTTIANSTTTPICQPNCQFDISVFSSAAAHLIIDVAGYMR
jgi:Subtilase family